MVSFIFGNFEATVMRGHAQEPWKISIYGYIDSA